MKKLLLFIFLLSSFAYAQDTAQISGKVLDGEMNNEPLLGATIVIKGTNTGTQTDFDGNYTLELAAGTHIIEFSFVGYNSTQETITIVAGENKTITKTLTANSLEEVIVVAETSKEKESALLLEQKKAVEIKQKIGAEELSRKNVGDVATALTKSSGVTKEEGGSGSIFVRGLGDRYNITTFNGLPLPSNNPSTKNISLDIFSTDIVESIGISKTLESQNYADFGGANININPKRHKKGFLLAIGLGSKLNTNVVKQNVFYLQDGPSFLGFNKINRPNQPENVDNHTQLRSWDRQNNANSTLNPNISLKIGNSFKFENGSKLNVFLTSGFANSSTFTEGINRGRVTGSGFIKTDYTQDSYTYNTNSKILGTADYKINSDHSILFSSLILNSTSQNYSEFEGLNDDFDGGLGSSSTYGFIKRGTFTRTKLLINQLVGKNKINDKFDVNWAIGYNISENNTPDRMQNTFVESRDGTNNFTFFTNGGVNNSRFYQDLTEKELVGDLKVRYKLNPDEDKNSNLITLGGALRRKKVDFISNLYSFRPAENFLIFSSVHNVDAILTNANITGGGSTQDVEQTYTGNQNIYSLYANYKHNFNEKFTVVLGARGESIVQDAFAITETDQNGVTFKLEEFKLLPSLIAKYSINDKNNIKFAASQSYTLPQFKEKIEILYEEVTQGYIGNKDLYESTNYNVDLSWEYFMNKGEILSINTFGKLIQNPINEAFVNSASGDISWVNSGDQATVMGAELEIKKNLLNFSKKENELETKLMGGVNFSYIRHEQELDNEKVSRENDIAVNFTFDKQKTSEKTGLTGASDITANADLTFIKEFSKDLDISSTITYSYFSDKLAVLGTQGRGNLVTKAVSLLDFSIKSNLTENLSIGVSLNNLLDPTFETIQEQGNVPNANSNAVDIVTRSFRKGRQFGFSVNYKF